MLRNLKSICEEIRRLIAYLRTLAGEDNKRGLLAARNFDRTLETISSDPQQGMSRLNYDIGGKGVLDWKWTEEHRIQIEKFSENIFQLIHPRA